MVDLCSRFESQFVLLDTEYTSWEGSQENNWSRPGECRELVQVGGYIINKTENNFSIDSSINLYIKPQINPILSQYFINLTGITQGQVNNVGISFGEAISILYNFSKDKSGNLIPIYSYGNDYNIIKENLKLNNYNLNSKFYDWSINFKDIRYKINDLVDVTKYTSGTLYKACTEQQVEKVHNSLWDCYSMYLFLKNYKTISNQV